MSSLPRPFGAYTLLRRLAVGGMAEIYVAKTRGLGGFEKLTALKLVHAHLSADPQFVRMLVDEAKILVVLTHANIAQVFDLGCVDERFFIAMEYVDGPDLHGLARAAERLGRTLPIPVCCFVVAEMLNGLDYAHRKRDGSGQPLGIVHRDISPQNVVVSGAGEVKLVDWGIAKTNLRAERTEVGVIKGKYGYMSPEQAWADPTDRRSDVFSAGVLLYELLTGSVLYSAKSVAELIATVRRAEIPPPRTVRGEISEQLSAIVMRALALEPSDRYQTALDMGDALREYLYASGQSMSGARLGRYVAETLEADEELRRERTAASADETGGMRALRREEFVRNEDSLIFSLPEGLTRSEPITVRPSVATAGSAATGGNAATGGSVAGGRSAQARVLGSELDELLAVPGPVASEPSAAQATAAASPPAAAPAHPPAETPDEPPTELWTQRWFAQQGTALDFATEIRVQGEVANDARQTARQRPISSAKLEPTSIVPPTLSWPPEEPSVPPRTAVRAPPPRAVAPPRGEDPSLAPLPQLGAMPDFRRNRKQRWFGRRELLIVLLLSMVGALGALLALERAPATAVEIWSDPRGARVRIDGAWQPGTTPMRVSGLRQGKPYRLHLEAPQHRPLDVELVVGEPDARERYVLTPE